MKLWFYLLDAGVSGLRARLRRDLANAQWLAAEVQASASWELVAPVMLQTVCVRHPAVDANAIARSVNERGAIYVTPSVARGVSMIRVSIGAERTELHHVKTAWVELQAAAERLAAPRPA